MCLATGQDSDDLHRFVASRGGGRKGGRPWLVEGPQAPTAHPQPPAAARGRAPTSGTRRSGGEGPGAPSSALGPRRGKAAQPVCGEAGDKRPWRGHRPLPGRPRGESGRGRCGPSGRGAEEGPSCRRLGCARGRNVVPAAARRRGGRRSRSCSGAGSRSGGGTTHSSCSSSSTWSPCESPPALRPSAGNGRLPGAVGARQAGPSETREWAGEPAGRGAAQTPGSRRPSAEKEGPLPGRPGAASRREEQAPLSSFGPAAGNAGGPRPERGGGGGLPDPAACVPGLRAGGRALGPDPGTGSVRRGLSALPAVLSGFSVPRTH